MGQILQTFACDNGILLEILSIEGTEADKEVNEWKSNYIESCKIRKKEKEAKVKDCDEIEDDDEKVFTYIKGIPWNFHY